MAEKNVVERGKNIQCAPRQGNREQRVNYVITATCISCIRGREGQFEVQDACDCEILSHFAAAVLGAGTCPLRRSFGAELESNRSKDGRKCTTEAQAAMELEVSLD